MTNFQGYALVRSDQTAFSWHPTFLDAQMRANWQRRVYGDDLRVVKDTEAIWLEVSHA